jgi:hypothetical protein
MTIRGYVSVGLLFLAAPIALAAQSAASPPAAESNPEPTKLVRRVIANQKKDEAALEVYERIERLETRKNASDASPAVVRISRVIPSGTGMDKIPLGADGKPPDPGSYRARLRALEHALALIVDNNRSQRDAMDKYAKKRRDRSDLIETTRNAFVFTFVRHEPRGDRMLAKYEMSPDPAFRPTSRFSAIFTKVHGYVWIDEDVAELARIEGDVTGDISIGLFLGKIYKGSHFMEERYEVLPGLWQASFSQYDFDGRKFFSGFSIRERTFYSNYRYIGPPKEALESVRKELKIADLGTPGSTPADP